MIRTPWLECLIFFGVVSAITGKIELVYEGEQEGAESVAKQLITNAVKTLFLVIFQTLKNLKRKKMNRLMMVLLIVFENRF